MQLSIRTGDLYPGGSLHELREFVLGLKCSIHLTSFCFDVKPALGLFTSFCSLYNYTLFYNNNDQLTH